MNVMSELMRFSQEKRLRPEAAIEAYVAQYEEISQQQQQQQQPQINLPPNGVPMQGNRTPSMQNMQMPNTFSSPAVSNLNLPMQPNGISGSPHLSNHPGLSAPSSMNMSHTPSPHQSSMAAPPMVPQHSQQGTNSSAASANTSPQVNNKRRRSTVKLEGESGEGGPGDGGQAGGQRVKPSPRMGKKNKPGG